MKKQQFKIGDIIKVDKNFLDLIFNNSSKHSYIGKVVETYINTTIIVDKTILIIYAEFDVYAKKYDKIQVVFYEFDFDKIIKI